MLDALKYLGKPWVSGANGPDAFDCWGLVKTVYKEEFSIDLSDHLQRQADNIRECFRLGTLETTSSDWVEVETPRTGDVVALSKNTEIHHVGIYFEQGRSVLHSVSGSGVIFQRISSMRQNGFQVFKFFRHASNS